MSTWPPARVAGVATRRLEGLGITDPVEAAEVATRWSWAEWRDVAPGCPDEARVAGVRWMRRQAGLPDWHGALL